MKELVRVGDITEVEFLRNTHGGKPICRIKGIIGHIDSSFDEFVAPRSVWMVEVFRIKEKSLLVLPIFKEKTPYENLKAIDDAIKHLVPEKKERKKEVKHYQYKSANERDNGKS